MNYSVTHHNDYNRVFFFNLNKSIKLALEVVITIDLLNKLEVALKAQ